MTTIISFDLDGTIITSDYADHVWLEGLPKLYAKEKNISYKKAKNLLTTAYDTMGDHSPEWYDLSYWFTRYHLTTHWTQLLQQYTNYITPHQDALTTIQQLTPHYPLIITSNAKREFIEIELQHTNLKKYFIKTFSSLSDFNQVKKNSQVYQQICDNLHIQPHDLIHVGDHYEHDYISPKKIGVQSYYLDRTQTHQKNSNHLSNLHELLDKLSLSTKG